MGRLHIKIPGVGVVTLYTEEKVGEVDVMRPGRLTVETYYYGINPSDMEKQFIKHNKKVWG